VRVAIPVEGFSPTRLGEVNLVGRTELEAKVSESAYDAGRPFVMVPDDLLLDPKVGPNMLRVYCGIARYADRRRRTAFPGYKRLAEDLALDRATISRAVAALERIGWIAVFRARDANGGRTTNRYLIKHRDDPTPSWFSGGDPGPPTPDMAQGVAPAQHPPVAPAQEGVAPVRPEPEPKNQNQKDGVDEIFQAWSESRRDVTGKASRVRLTNQRRQLIERRMREGYSVDELVDAVTGWKHSSHHCGENERGTIYCDLNLLLRDADHIERFRDLSVEQRRRDEGRQRSRERQRAREQSAIADAEASLGVSAEGARRVLDDMESTT
jgi:hypothetical protein